MLKKWIQKRAILRYLYKRDSYGCGNSLFFHINGTPEAQIADNKKEIRNELYSVVFVVLVIVATFAYCLIVMGG